MMIFGLKSKSLMSNVINRLKILVFEEIPVNEFNKIVVLIEILEQIENADTWEEKVEKVLKFIELSKTCKRGRICSYANTWWRYNSEKYDFELIQINNVNKYKKKGDSEELLKLGEQLIHFIENRDIKMIDIFNKITTCKDT